MPSPLAPLAPTAFAVSILEHHSCALHLEKKTRWHPSMASAKALRGEGSSAAGLHRTFLYRIKNYSFTPRYPPKYMPSPLAPLAPTVFAVSTLEHHSCTPPPEKKTRWHPSTASSNQFPSWILLHPHAPAYPVEEDDMQELRSCN